MKSRVHPTYKTKYRVANWASYDRALVGRGDVTLWLAPEAIDAWAPGRVGTRGGQFKYSDLAIETALTLRGVPTDERLHLTVDSTGLSIAGEGEWAAVKHGRRGKRGWKKLHVGVDRSGVIVAQALTEGNADDATTALTLIEAVEGALASVTGDAAYDTIAFYDAAGARGANVVVPPTKASSVSRRGRRSSARDRTIRMVKALGRRRWKREAGYQRQARAENAFFRYKSIIGDGLRARTPGGRVAEALLACNLLNQMTALGKPESYGIGR